MNLGDHRRTLTGTVGATLGFALALGLGTWSAQAYEPVGLEPRFSTVDSDGVAARDAQEPTVAYNSTANEYLVVWEADGLATDEETEIFGQRVSAAGVELGGDFRISEAGPEADASRDARAPVVSYNTADNQYLVVWEADDDLVTDDKFEIHGQLLNPTGGDIGGDFQISSTGVSTDASQGAVAPAVSYNPNSQEYAVVWHAGNINGSNTVEIYGQRINAAGVQEPSATDIQISNGSAMGTGRQALHPSIAYGAAPDEYLVTWDGDGLATDNDYEIFGQRLEDDGDELGGDFRISTTGIETQVFRAAIEPTVAYGSGPNEYLVTWWADALAVDNEVEIFGQRVSAAGAEVGASDFRISTTLPDNTNTRAALRQATAYSPTGNEYLVTWTADALSTDEEFEIFGQRLSAAGGDIGTSDFRISNAGTDGTSTQDAEDSALAFGSTPNEYLVIWAADPLATDEEFEIFGQRLAPAAPQAETPPAATATPVATCTKPKKTKKKKKRAAASKKKKKKKKKRC